MPKQQDIGSLHTGTPKESGMKELVGDVTVTSSLQCGQQTFEGCLCLQATTDLHPEPVM